MRKENVIEITEDVKIGNGVVLEKGDRIRIIENTWTSPIDIPEINIRANDIVVIIKANIESSGIYRMQVQNPRTKEVSSFVYDDKLDALEAGWEI